MESLKRKKREQGSIPRKQTITNAVKTHKRKKLDEGIMNKTGKVEKKNEIPKKGIDKHEMGKER